MAILVNDSLRISYHDLGPANGKAPPVLLLHSSAASRRQWRSFVEAESVRRRCLAPDLIGYGETADRQGRVFSMAQEMEVVDSLRALAGGPVHLVGHSYGGAVAAAYAQAHADQVLSLTLIEPVLFTCCGTMVRLRNGTRFPGWRAAISPMSRPAAWMTPPTPS